MRRSSRLPPPRGFRSSDWRQIVSMLALLALVYFVWDWARDPNVWRWLADDAGAEDVDTGGWRPSKPAAAPVGRTASPSHNDVGRIGNPSHDNDAVALGPRHVGNVPHEAATAPPPPAAGPAATGPTDEDPDERDAMRDEFQAITDKTLEIQPEEMFAYKRMVQWVVNQPASVMRKRARTDLTFNDFMTSPDKCRGALVEMMLNARMVRTSEYRASDGTDLFEVWGFTADSGAWLYDTIVVGLPKGMPAGVRINERVRFVGYFLKLQGYYEANARPHAPPLVAPVLIGRLIWIQAPPPAPSHWDASWAVIAVVGFGLIVALRFLWLFLRPRRRRSSLKPIGKPRPGELTIDEWFERAEQGTAPVEQRGEVATPREPAVAGDGNGQGMGELFSHPLDGEVPGGG